jgi:hypothetical protein
MAAMTLAAAPAAISATTALQMLVQVPIAHSPCLPS